MRKVSYNIIESGKAGLRMLASDRALELAAEWDETTEVDWKEFCNAVASGFRLTNVPDPSYGYSIIRDACKKTIRDLGFGLFPLGIGDDGYSIGRGKTWVVAFEVNGTIPVERAHRVKLLYTNRADYHRISSERHRGKYESDQSVARKAARLMRRSSVAA